MRPRSHNEWAALHSTQCFHTVEWVLKVKELNGIDDLQSLFDQANDDIAAQNRIMQRADAYCLNDPTCPFHDQGKGSVIKVSHVS